jgi:hypothetical protein
MVCVRSKAKEQRCLNGSRICFESLVFPPPEKKMHRLRTNVPLKVGSAFDLFFPPGKKPTKTWNSFTLVLMESMAEAFPIARVWGLLEHSFA